MIGDVLSKHESRIKIDGKSYDGGDRISISTYKGDSVSTLPYEFDSGGAVVYNNEIHILGSSGPLNSSIPTNHYKWNGSTWTSVSTLPYEFKGSAVVLNNEIHILGGYASDTYTNHYKYNGSTWTSVSTLPCGGYPIVYNDEIHIINSGSSKPHYKYNGSTWTLVSTLPYQFKYLGAVVYNNEIHIIGTPLNTYNALHYKYNGSKWSRLTESNPDNGRIVVYNNEMHLLCTDLSSTYHAKWNATSSRWYPTSDLPYAFNDTGSAVVYNNGIHMLGGGSSAYNSDDHIKHYVLASTLNDCYQID